MTTWMACGRAGGKTEALLRWMLDGDPLPDGGWSRAIVTPSVRMREHLIQRGDRMAGRSVAEQILVPARSGQGMMPFTSADRLRKFPDAQVAVDDTELLLSFLLDMPGAPEVVAGLGVAARPRVPSDGGATTIEPLPGQGEPVPPSVREHYDGTSG